MCSKSERTQYKTQCPSTTLLKLNIYYYKKPDITVRAIKIVKDKVFKTI